MRRREFVTLLSGAAVAWPLAARAQQPALPIVGFLSGSSADTYTRLVSAYKKGLDEIGFADGRDLTIEYRWAEGHYEKLPALAADLVHRQVAVIVSSSSTASVAAKEATSIIPIVFSSGEDPVKAGLVTSLNRPGGNVTGIYNFLNGLEEKRLGLLRDLVPRANVIGAIVNPSRTDAEIQARDLQDAARALGEQIHILSASTAGDVDAAFAKLSQLQCGALIVGADPAFIVWRKQIVALAERYGVPAIYALREFSMDGGLLSYGTNLADAYVQAGIYTGKILKGEKPADLPVVQSTKFELIINVKTAKALGLAIPSGVLAIADEVIE
jgi:putative tryptophan/tyrosine transport system substrate-binding protein